MTHQEYATTEALAGVGIIIAQNAKAAGAWGWSLQNDKIIRDWDGPYTTPAGASAAALAWLMEYARKGLLCHHIHTEPAADGDALMPWERAFLEGIPEVEE